MKLIELIKKLINQNKKNTVNVENNALEPKEKTKDSMNILLEQEDSSVEEVKKENVDNINWDLINSLKESTIVFVKMNDSDIVSSDIDERHKKRPLVVTRINNNDNTITGYYCTSNINNKFYIKEEFKGFRIVLNKEKYSNLKKNSLVLLNEEKIIPYESVISYIETIDTRDLNRIKKYSNLISHKKVISNKDNCIIEIGDIVEENKTNYIIYQKDNSNCYGYVIKDSDNKIDNDPHYIKFGSKNYYIDYQANKVFKCDSEITIVDRFNDKVVSIISENKKTLKLNKKNSKQKSKSNDKQGLSTDDLNKIIDYYIEQLGADSLYDVGPVMNKVIPKVKGKCNINKVATMVNNRLSK